MQDIQFSQLIPWINLGVIIISTLLMFYFYMKSASPAQLEKKIGEIAYKKCGRYRVIASVFELIVIGCYIVYNYYPLPISLPQTFPWPYWISFSIALIITIPFGYIMLRGVLDAGEEALIPKKKHKLYGGIYNKIRHPQAMGELPLWWALSFFLNSPFLALYSIVFIPIFVSMTFAEEKDLLIRYGDKYSEYKKRTGYIIPKL
jgi:protein-S-isoprenylcysteine O-methyltransferase Ste14